VGRGLKDAYGFLLICVLCNVAGLRQLSKHFPLSLKVPLFVLSLRQRSYDLSRSQASRVLLRLSCADSSAMAMAMAMG